VSLFTLAFTTFPVSIVRTDTCTLEVFLEAFNVRSMREPDSAQRGTTDVNRRPPTTGSGVFHRGKRAQDLILVKIAFWAFVVGVVLFVGFVLWGLATHDPSQFRMDSGDP
jgi:hypothetical protein